MNVEILEFYPIEKNEKKEALSGTLRINLPDIGIHILGIFVAKKKENWFFSLPGRNGTHHETGESVRYPAVVFENREKQKELIEAIREKGRAFILQRLENTETPLVFPPKAIKKLPIQSAPKNKVISAKAKETDKKSGFQIDKEYVDLPPLKKKKSFK